MSEFKNKSLTTKGMELVSKALSGGKIEFTRIEMGSGTFSGDISNVEGLVEVKQNLKITNIVRKGGQVTLSAILKIEDITTEYDWSEIGVYAKGADEVEVLYMYGHTDNTSFISKTSLNEKLINVTVLVSNVADVTATIDGSIVYLTREALEDHNNSETSHNDIRELINQLKLEVDTLDISWEGISGKPETFPPSEHTHDYSPTGHKHTKAEITDFPTSLPANGGNADTLDGFHALSFTNYKPLINFGKQGNITTAQFIQKLTELGAFATYNWVARGSWSYADNPTINDTGCGDIPLAGAVVEVFKSDASFYTIRVTTATATNGTGLINSEFIYVNNGDAYFPKWRRAYNTESTDVLQTNGTRNMSITNTYPTITQTNTNGNQRTRTIIDANSWWLEGAVADVIKSRMRFDLNTGELYLGNNTYPVMSRIEGVKVTANQAYDKAVQAYNLANSSAIKSVQRGSVVIRDGLSTTVAISTINMSKSFLLLSCSDYYDYINANMSAEGYIQSATSLYIARNYDSSYSTTIYWQVVEFN